MYSSLQNSAPRALAQALAEGRCKSKHAILLNVSRYCKGLNSPAAAKPLPSGFDHSEVRDLRARLRPLSNPGRLPSLCFLTYLDTVLL